MARTTDTAAPNTTFDTRETLQVILGSIRRNLVRVIFTTLVFVLLGMGLNMIWPSKYESTTQFMVNEVKIIADPALLGDLQDLPLTRKLQSLTNEMRSSNRISAVMDELNWVEWLGTHGRPAKRRALLEKIKSNLDVEMTPDVTSKINVSLSFQWTSPKDAAAFVNRTRDSWIKLVMDGYRRGVEKGASEAEAVVLERQAAFDLALEARQKYQQENDVPGLLDTENNNEIKADLLVKISEAQAALESTVTEIEIVKADMLTTPKDNTVLMPPENPEQGVALLALQEAEAAFKAVEVGYLPDHWRYKQAKSTLDKAKAELVKTGGVPEKRYTTETNPAYYALARRLNELEARERESAALVTNYTEQLKIVDDRLVRLPRVTTDLARLNANVLAANQLLDQAKLEVQPYKDQLRSLRQSNSLLAGSEGLVSSGPFEILEQGIEPEAPVLPIGALIMAMSLLLGIAVGLSGPVLGELTRSSFGSVKEVSRSLGVPVLGAVDLILTARDVRARNVQSILTVTTMVLVLVALGAALYIYGYHRDALPATVNRALADIRMALT